MVLKKTDWFVIDSPSHANHVGDPAIHLVAPDVNDVLRLRLVAVVPTDVPNNSFDNLGTTTADKHGSLLVVDQGLSLRQLVCHWIPDTVDLEVGIRVHDGDDDIVQGDVSSPMVLA